MIAALIIFIGSLALLALYALPSWIAFRRRHPNRWLILVLNVAVGSTGVGWLAALVWALYRAHLPDDPTQSRGGESGLNIFVNDVKRIEGPLAIGSAVVVAGSSGERDLAWATGELERLGRLRLAGDLTDEEHRALKQRVLRDAGVA